MFVVTPQVTELSHGDAATAGNGDATLRGKEVSVEEITRDLLQHHDCVYLLAHLFRI